jgi:hypothetical protein
MTRNTIYTRTSAPVEKETVFRLALKKVQKILAEAFGF